MKTQEIGAIIALLLCTGLTLAANKDQDVVASAVNHADRPDADKQRDADRKPAEILKFYDVKPGMKVVDLMTGGGYYAELLSRIVGPEGKVLAQNNQTSGRVYSKAIERRIANSRLPNVEYVNRELTALDLGEGELDAVFMVLFYHDTYWMKVDRAKMNRDIYAALKPGGIFAVIDHSAEVDSRDRDVQTLHRVDEEMVRKEILSAGFLLVEESKVLRHPDDDRKTRVFDIRGKTDRFVLKFQKPE